MFFQENFTQFSFPSLCVLLEGNIEMVESEDGERLYNDKLLSLFSVDLKLCLKKLTMV